MKEQITYQLLSKPLLLDGATATNLQKAGMPAGICPAEWLLSDPSHEAILAELHRGFLEAGSQLIYTPTANANSVMLAEFGQEDKTAEYNRILAEKTVAVCKAMNPDVLIAGCVAPLNIQAEPFGDTPFLDIVNIYAQQAFALKEGGVDLLVADTMTSLSQCRAAILGCRQTRLPVMVTLNIEEDGETCFGCDLVSALIVCQALGASAFGLSCCDKPQSIYTHLEEIAPYAKIPLIVKPNAGNSFADVLPPTKMAKDAIGLWERGAVLVGGCCYTTPEHIAAMKEEMQRFNFDSVRIPKEDDETICVASETHPFFLDETFEQSDPIRCKVDMSDELLEIETSGVDVVTVEITSIDDAYRFALNAHMLRMPVSFLSDSEEALEMALLMYPGRAFVDSHSSIEETLLMELAHGYGAIVR